MTDPLSLEGARALDAADPLARFRSEFHIPKAESSEDCIYLCGNSLGLQPARTETMLLEELADWREFGVEGHLHARRPWLPYHENLTDLLAELVGAEPNEVIAMNTLTVNLHLLLVSFYRPSGRRRKLLIEKPAFPSDRYAAESQVRFHGLDPADALVEVGPREGEDHIRAEDIAAAIADAGDELACILWGGVQYYSGQAFDLAEITRQGHAVGAVVGFDLAHAVGNLDLALHDSGADFAAWCSYKYLNGGPGAVAGAYVHSRHAESFDLPRFAGWWGHDKASRFKMGPQFVPMSGAEGWQLSNPPILSLTPVLASLELIREAGGMAALRAKSLKLTDLMARLLESRLAGRVAILTPDDPHQRGCQLSLRIIQAGTDGRAVFDRLVAAGVVADWREPDVIRVAPVPLYNSFEDAHAFVDRLATALG
jgi:kynureninase